jgi:hypothetical protein
MTATSAPTPRHWPAWIAGSAWNQGTPAEVTHPGDGSLVGTYSVPDAAAVEAAVEAAWSVRKVAQATTAAQRAAALTHVSRRLEERVDEVAALITAENGKPITWARAEALRGAALAACGTMGGDEDEISRGAATLGASLAHLPLMYSPLDTASTSHAMGVALMALGEASDDDRLFDEAITSFDRALEPFEANPEIAQRPVCAYDRATAITRRAERRGDMASLDYAERAFRAELSGLAASLDPVAWAVVQVALARVYSARAAMTGDEDQRSRATLALSAALDVFTERGLRSLAEVAMSDLDRIRVRV